MDELGLDAQLLEAMAEAAGGRFLREGEFDRLDDLLRPLRRGRVEERETLLWQSWWWFVPIVALLAVEWALRKRAGLV